MIFIECKFQLSKIITNPFSFHIPFCVCSAVIIIRMRNFDFILWQLWQWNDLRELLLLSKIMWSFMALIWDEMEINSLIRDILFSKERLEMKSNIDVWAIWNKLGFKGAIRVILSGFFRLHWSLYWLIFVKEYVLKYQSKSKRLLFVYQFPSLNNICITTPIKGDKFNWQAETYPLFRAMTDAFPITTHKWSDPILCLISFICRIYVEMKSRYSSFNDWCISTLDWMIYVFALVFLIFCLPCKSQPHYHTCYNVNIRTLTFSSDYSKHVWYSIQTQDLSVAFVSDLNLVLSSFNFYTNAQNIRRIENSSSGVLKLW